MNKHIYIVFITVFVLFSCNNSGEKINEKVNSDNLSEVVTEKVIKHDVTENLRFTTAVENKIDHYFGYRNKIGRFNGVVLFADGKKVFQKAYGYSNYRSKEKLSLNTSFQLASVSKTVTAVATMMLEQEGKLALSDSVQKFIPSFPYKGITIEQLLSHRSGLGNYVYWTEPYWKKSDSLMTNNEMLELMSENIPAVYYSPNRRYNYNNTNYSLLASIIESISGLPFNQFLKKNIFDPLKMDHTFLYTPDNFKKYDAATGYKNKRRPYSPFYLDGVYGDKGLFSTVGDLYKFDLGLRIGLLLNDKTKIDSYTNRSRKYRKPYGLGWRIGEYNGKKLIYHHGWWRGFKSYFIRSIDDGKTIIVLTNNLHGSKMGNSSLMKLLDYEEELSLLASDDAKSTKTNI